VNGHRGADLVGCESGGSKLAGQEELVGLAEDDLTLDRLRPGLVGCGIALEVVEQLFSG
jgi:hypothetical protein